jgi:undecaprenyl-diphosphatase
MDLLSSIILGIVQGLTEFFPISSSGHLVLFQYLFGMKEPEILLDVSLHFGTLLAILLVFKDELSAILIGSVKGFISLLSNGRFEGAFKDETKWILLIVIGNIPSGVAGICFRDFLDPLFGSIRFVGIALLFTGFLLWFTKGRSVKKTEISEISYGNALLIGISQAIAIAPGISRSGATISMGLLLGLERDLSARFSFFLSIPAIAGAMALEILSSRDTAGNYLYLITGVILSALTGYLALKFLIKVVRKGDLYLFSPYVWSVGILILIISTSMPKLF